jgi:hypothetical protein
MTRPESANSSNKVTRSGYRVAIASRIVGCQIQPGAGYKLSAQPPLSNPQPVINFGSREEGIRLDSQLCHIKHASLMLECSSLPPTLNFRPELNARPAVSSPLPASTAKDSTIHSYQIFRSSLWRHMLTTNSPWSGTYNGV